MKIMIVDDEDMMRELLVEIFEEEGNQVFSATNGEDALKVYQQSQPDTIILDVMMPGIDGLEVCQKIRTEYKDQQTRILLLTGQGGHEVKEKGEAVGANKVLFKPIPTGELLEVVLRK